jgi:uncharacterized membrane protein HdeD (DUF308 family)
MATQAHFPDQSTEPLLHALAQNWWLLLLKGLCAIVFGFLAFAWPGITLTTLILLYAAFAFADGALAVVAALRGGTGNGMGSRWWLAFVGLCGIAAGIVAVVWPGLTALVLLFLIAFWAIAIGIAEIIGAIRLRKEIEGEWWLILSGIVSVLFGIALLMRPATGALAVVWLIGAFAIAYGVLTIGLALRLRRHHHSGPVQTAP